MTLASSCARLIADFRCSLPRYRLVPIQSSSKPPPIFLSVRPRFYGFLMKLSRYLVGSLESPYPDGMRDDMDLAGSAVCSPAPSER